MEKKKKKVLIIGGGIHGCFLAKYLNKKKFDITIIEKENDICMGSSHATHNRANRGYHYPRSINTAKECLDGYDYFNKNYKPFLSKAPSYYCIEKNSKTNLKKYIIFCKKNKLPFKLIKKNNTINNQSLEGIVLGEEGCYNHYKLKNYLSTYLKATQIKKYFNFNLKKVSFSKSTVRLLSSNKIIIEDNFDTIINATYDNTNIVRKIFHLKKNLPQKYLHQQTEIIRVRSTKKFLGITIMDGPFVTIMPHIGKKNEYLLYDVENSILREGKKNIPNKKYKSNYKKIIKKLKKYINYTNELKYVGSYFGNRPIPLSNTEADRSVKVVYNKLKNGINFISIREGKYISAPLTAKRLSLKI